MTVSRYPQKQPGIARTTDGTFARYAIEDLTLQLAAQEKIAAAVVQSGNSRCRRLFD
jgi:hypothetical protein